MADFCLSGAALTVVAMLLAALSGTIAVLFKALLAAKQEQINDWRDIAQQGAGLTQESLGLTKEIARRR